MQGAFFYTQKAGERMAGSIKGITVETVSYTHQMCIRDRYGGTLKTYTVLQCPLYERDSEEDGNRRIESHAIAKAL